jgi:4-amino-4-deoxy-L-arabinose transferase-like glycosyltransferase
VFGAVALFPFLGQTHDVSSHEIRHAEIGREMAASGDFLIPTLLGRPYQDKLPLMSSAVALLYGAAGGPSMALARLPSALAGIVGAMLLYGIGCTLAGRRAAWLAAIGLLGLQGYQDVARTARPDMLFVAAILLACWTSTRALAGNAKSGGFAIAGAACAAASALKGPLAWVFCTLFPYTAWLYGDAMRRPRASDWAAFVVGFAAAAAIWVIPVVHRDGGAYLWSFLTQPDLTTWHLVDSVRRVHWPWLYGAIGLLPLALLLPLAVKDALRQGLRPPLAIALAMLIVLSIIPKKRMHYPAPVLPFLALAIVASVEHRDIRARLAVQALVAIGLVSALFYFGVVLPRLRPGEDVENVAARRILERLDPVFPVVCFGEMAERLAFLGRRTEVSEITDDESLNREIERRGRSASVVLPSTYPSPANLRPTTEVETSVGSWWIYRVEPRVDSG